MKNLSIYCMALNNKYFYSLNKIKKLINKKNYPYIFLFFSIIFATLIWSYITIPYDDDNLINGEYFQKKLNPLNDTVRAIFFIFFPLFIFFISFLKLSNSLSFWPTNQNFFLKKKYGKIDRSLELNIVSLFFIIFVIIEFLTINIDIYLGKIDTHHEGTFLVAPLNYLIKNQIWLGTFFDYGAIGNNIALIYSKFFGNYSIGINRFGGAFLTLLNKILLILICLKIVVNLSLDKGRLLFFIIFSLLTLTLTSYHYANVTPFHYRLFIYLLFFLLLINILMSKKPKIILLIILGIFSLISALFYIDIGAYINATLFFAVIFLIFQKKYVYSIFIILGILASWICFILILPIDEIMEFSFQFSFITSVSDYLLGIEYPQPFSNKSTRYTKALIFIIISGIFVINFLFNKDLKINYRTKVFLIFAFISSIILFKSGLMRSDGPHIKYSSGFYMLIIFFSLTYCVFLYLQKKEFFNRLENLIFEKKIVFILMLSFSFLVIQSENIFNIKNVFNFNKNIFSLTKSPDNQFLSKKYLTFISEFKKISEKDSCVQQFTDDNALPYFLNKPTCTQFYYNAHIISNWTEDKFLEQLKEASPSFIVYRSNINWFKNLNNAPKADKFILDNYSLFKKIYDWEVYKINN